MNVEQRIMNFEEAILNQKSLIGVRYSKINPNFNFMNISNSQLIM